MYQKPLKYIKSSKYVKYFENIIGYRKNKSGVFCPVVPKIF